MATEQEKVLNSILKDNIIYELAGYENAYLDEDITEEEFEKNLTFEKAMQIADNEMSFAYKKGYIESRMGEETLEAKHLKFIGNDRLDYIKGVACRNALKRF